MLFHFENNILQKCNLKTQMNYSLATIQSFYVVKKFDPSKLKKLQS